MAFLSATECTEAAGRREDVFKYTVPIDLASIFTGYGPLSAVDTLTAAGETALVMPSTSEARPTKMNTI